MIGTSIVTALSTTLKEEPSNNVSDTSTTQIQNSLHIKLSPLFRRCAIFDYHNRLTIVVVVPALGLIN